jgi:hypothetical protein
MFLSIHPLIIPSGTFIIFFLSKIWNDSEKSFKENSLSFAVIGTARKITFQNIGNSLQIVFSIDETILWTMNISPSIFEKLFSLHSFHSLFKTITEKQTADTDNQDFLRSLSCLLIGFAFKYSEIKYGSGGLALANFKNIPLILGNFSGSNRTFDFI